jgi:alpha-tubulin suppressor-like RCC1 family protein
VNDFTPVLPFEKIKLIATGDNHTIAVTKGNKLFHFGRTKGKLPSSKTPIEFGLR